MKSLLMIIIPLVVFIGLSIWIQMDINNYTNEFTDHLNRIESAVSNEDWQTASTEIESAKKSWEPKRKKWKTIIDHMEIERIDQSIARVSQWAALKVKKDCLVELKVLEKNILHIPEKERISLSNIF